jgi:hypothetical protein
VHRSCLRGEDGAVIPCTAEWCRSVEALRRAPMREALDAAPCDGPVTALGDAIAAHLGWMPGARAMLDALIRSAP